MTDQNNMDLFDLYEQAMKLQDYIDNNEGDIDYNKVFKDFGLDLEQIENEIMENNTKLPLGYVKLHPDAIDPFYNYQSDSGFDLYSIIDIEIPPFGRELIPTGLSFDIKDGYEIQVRSKSGLALKQGLMVLNSPGTVDCFSEDMRILTINGEKHIKDLKINDIVFSFNEKSLEIEKDIVLKIFDTDVQDILKIETEEGVLEVTPNSEIYTNKGIVLAKELQENDEIIVFF